MTLNQDLMFAMESLHDVRLSLCIVNTEDLVSAIMHMTWSSSLNSFSQTSVLPIGYLKES
jgi:hypothetical protein